MSQRGLRRLPALAGADEEGDNSIQRQSSQVYIERAQHHMQKLFEGLVSARHVHNSSAEHLQKQTFIKQHNCTPNVFFQLEPRGSRSLDQEFSRQRGGTEGKACSGWNQLRRRELFENMHPHHEFYLCDHHYDHHRD